MIDKSRLSGPARKSARTHPVNKIHGSRRCISIELQLQSNAEQSTNFSYYLLFRWLAATNLNIKKTHFEIDIEMVATARDHRTAGIIVIDSG